MVGEKKKGGKGSSGRRRRRSTFRRKGKVEEEIAVVVEKDEEEDEEDDEDEDEDYGGEHRDDPTAERAARRRARMDIDYPDKGSGNRGRGENGEAGEEEEENGEGKEGQRLSGEGEDNLLPPPIHPPEEQSPAESNDLVKVILLGAPAVGKTSIIQQFVWNEFCDTYYPTDRRHTYYPSVVINGRLYDLKISDLPPVPYFPVDSLYEWTDFRSYGLRSATAYVLVFDLSNATDTFRHIKCLREQMAGSRDMKNVPVVVVGNKHDKLHGPIGVEKHQAHTNVSHSTGFGLPGTSSSLPSGSSQAQMVAHHSGLGHANSLLFQHHQANALAESRERRDIANIVKKHWRCGYVECSAKYNWRVVAVFKELMKAIDSMDGRANTGGGVLSSLGGNEPQVSGVHCGGRAKDTVASFHVHRHHSSHMVVDNLHDALDRSKCEVL